MAQSTQPIQVQDLSAAFARLVEIAASSMVAYRPAQPPLPCIAGLVRCPDEPARGERLCEVINKSAA